LLQPIIEAKHETCSDTPLFQSGSAFSINNDRAPKLPVASCCCPTNSFARFASFRRAYVVVQQRVVQGIGEAPRARALVIALICESNALLRDLQWLPLPGGTRRAQRTAFPDTQLEKPRGLRAPSRRPRRLSSRGCLERAVRCARRVPPGQWQPLQVSKEARFDSQINADHDARARGPANTLNNPLLHDYIGPSERGEPREGIGRATT